MIALMEYEWLTGKSIIEKDSLEKVITLIQRGTINPEVDEFAFWMKKAGRTFTPRNETAERYDTGTKAKAVKAANFWEHSGYPYEQALLLFEGNDEDKRDAISILQDLNATAVYEKLKLEMKNQGIKNIPRGIRNSTRSNAAFLTGREMDVLQLMQQELQNKEIAAQLFISAKTVDHHISSILFKLDAGSRTKAVTEAVRIGILK
jgi:DNA-binding CsgD family transcriptional regulator